ncbi:MAG TPA: hypothetical protein DCQ04_06590 [Actinobacteria bacterium]|nr:hypothetical protein [Actinomycetota bacterium]
MQARWIGIASLAVGSLLLWIRSPRVKEGQLHEDVWRAAAERHDKAQQEAGNLQKNAYLSSTFQPYWGIEKDRRTGCFVERVVREWLHCWLADDGEPIEPIYIDPEYKRWRAEFEALADELRVELKKPFFVVPGDMWSRHWESLNDGHIRRLAKALHQLAKAHVEEGNFDKAALTFLDAIRLSGLIQTEGGERSISGKALQIESIREFTELVPPDAPLGDKWRFISRALLESVPAENEAVTWLEDLTASYRLAHRHPTPSSRRRLSILDFPGIRAREERLFCNLMTPLLLAIRASKRPVVPSVDSGLMVHRPSQFTLDSMLYLSHLSGQALRGLGVATALLAHQAEYGLLPTSLEALAIPIPEGLTWSVETKCLTAPLKEHRLMSGFKELLESDWLEVHTSGSTSLCFNIARTGH